MTFSLPLNIMAKIIIKTDTLFKDDLIGLAR